jgi:predicted GIY-YIG superfamily endonuclease
MASLNSTIRGQFGEVNRKQKAPLSSEVLEDNFNVSESELFRLELEGHPAEVDPIVVKNRKEKVHGVYILASLDWKYTYVGYTVDFKRRLRQHNREIKGGAKATAGRTWRMILQITGLPDKHHALSLEWHLKKYPVCRSDVKRFGCDTFPINSPSKSITRRLRRLMVVMERRKDKFPNLTLTF